MYKGYSLGRILPQPKLVSDFTRDVISYIFPIYEAIETSDFARGSALLNLKEQLQDQLDISLAGTDKNSTDIIETFFLNLPTIGSNLLEDAKFILDYDPAANSLEEIILCYPGFHAIAVYRLAHLLCILKVPLLPKIMSAEAHSKTGIDINAGAQIGCPFFIDHGTGIVIGETAVIGDYVKLYQGVTLGALAVRKEDAAIKRHPTIEDNVVIYSGSTILGGTTVIGNDCIIGGSTWITASVPAFSIVYHNAQTFIKDRRDFNEPINFII